MTIATSTHVKIRANSDGYDKIPTSIFNNFRQELEVDNQYPLVLQRAASSEAKLPSYIDNGCDDGIDIDIIDDIDTLSISSSDDSFIIGSEYYNTQHHVVNSSFDSFIRIDDSDYDSIASYNSDDIIMLSSPSSQQQQRLATVESGIALSDLETSSPTSSPTSSSRPKMEKSPSDNGCRSSMAFLPPLHPSSSSSNSHGALLPQSNDSTTNAVAEQQRTHRANDNNMSSSSYYSLDAGKHGFLTHHTPAASVDSLVFQYQDDIVLVPKSGEGGGEGEEEEEEEEANTPPIAHGTSVEVDGRELSPRCILPYQERKRLMELEEDDHNGEHSRESSSSSSPGRFLELEEKDQKDAQDQQQQGQQHPEKVTASKSRVSDEGLSSPKAECFTRLFARVTKKAKKSRRKISRMRRFCMSWMMKKN